MKKYKLIGLTGTTGAGKSQVCEFFRADGYSIINADILARKAVENPLVLSLLVQNFGDDILNDGTLNRRLLGERAFSCKEKTDLLNLITHPFISALFVEEIEKLTNNGINRIVFDAPQLFESKLNILCDTIIGVVADRQIRIERIMKRDNISCENAQKRILVQFSSDFFKHNCDYIIENNSTVEQLEKSTLTVIEKL